MSVKSLSFIDKPWFVWVWNGAGFFGLSLRVTSASPSVNGFTTISNKSLKIKSSPGSVELAANVIVVLFAPPPWAIILPLLSTTLPIKCYFFTIIVF